MALSAAAREHLATRKYHDRQFDIMAVKVLPGEYYATQDDVMITTLLGSCVAVCLYDPKIHAGGMNHFLLPEGDASDFLSESGRYGVYAMEMLINHLLKLGARRERFRAKIFGGGNVIRGMTHNNVGGNNADFIQTYLKNEGIPIEASDLLDIYPRRVNFFPASGRVMMKKLVNHYDNEFINEEMRYKQAVTKSRQETGDIDLF
ncbi:chemoreceptor glutamine deamidase CheD [Maribrevibacterium harenarium]|uniref:Probable chemoreceptor glutamine deamidase CheD n=1 Tax=Maribrevibacterium harenarium TaxID=2589817 RepID=A0A501WVY3_9GAMM|nr:chemoreceptor glutamine deamidase CheD [Maribrevibacterium harenarium]TPE51547.1 chemoreceptor glutamine deamidase CheD [Maribrevibacterium harenarium]